MAFLGKERDISAIVLLLFVVLFNPEAVFSQEAREMSAVEVRATSLERQLSSSLAKYGNQVEVITGEELEKTGHTDINQALQMVAPGIYSAPKNGRADYTNISIQGGRQVDVLWLLDGVRFNNRLFSTTTILDSISVHMIKRIEILKGGQGLFYGTQAVSGVINIITKDPKSSTGGEYGVGLGTLGDRSLHGHVTGSVNENTSVLVFGNHDESDGFRPFKENAYETTATITDRGFERTNMGLKIEHSFDTGQRLNLHLQHNNVKADFARPFNQFQNALNDRDQTILSAKWEQRVSDRFSYFVKAYYHAWWTDFTRVAITDQGNLKTINNNDEWGFDDSGFNVLGRYDLEDGSQLLGGVDYQQYEGHDRVINFEADEETVVAPFFQYRPELWFSPETNLALGGRFNKADFTEDKFIWNVSFRHPIGTGTYLRGRSGTAFRLPSGFELFFPGLGNSNLEAEESLNNELGLGGVTSLGKYPLSWDVTLFYREIDELIQTVSGQFQNVNNQVEVEGAEAKLGLQLGPAWQLTMSGTLSNAAPSGTSRQINNVPESLFKSMLSYEAPAGRYGVKISHLYVGNVFDQPVANRVEFGNYHLFDLSSYYYHGPARKHKFTARVGNLLDEEYFSQLDSGDAVGGGEFVYGNRGTPMNLQIDYTYYF